MRVRTRRAAVRASTIGAVRSRTVSSVMMTFLMSRCEGISYMMSRITSSMIVRRARAPVERVMASSAIACRASSVNCRSTPSYSKNLRYCLISAFFGSVRIWTSASWSRARRVATTGRRPMNSGIRPYLSRSSGMTCWSMSPACRSRLL